MKTLPLEKQVANLELSKELKELLIKCDKRTDRKMKEWWNRILPCKGSLLRQLILRYIN